MSRRDIASNIGASFPETSRAASRGCVLAGSCDYSAARAAASSAPSPLYPVYQAEFRFSGRRLLNQDRRRRADQLAAAIDATLDTDEREQLAQAIELMQRLTARLEQA